MKTQLDMGTHPGIRSRGSEKWSLRIYSKFVCWSPVPETIIIATEVGFSM